MWILSGVFHQSLNRTGNTLCRISCMKIQVTVGARCIFGGFLIAVSDFSHLVLEGYNIWYWKAKYSILTVVLSSADQLLKLEM